MFKSGRFLLIFACTFAGGAVTAVAETKSPRSWDQETRYGLSQRNQDIPLDKNIDLRRDPDYAGVFERTGPYRFALPLASFGEKGPKLLFTYIPRMKDGVASRVFMFVVRVNID